MIFPNRLACILSLLAKVTVSRTAQTSASLHTGAAADRSVWPGSRRDTRPDSAGSHEVSCTSPTPVPGMSRRAAKQGQPLGPDNWWQRWRSAHGRRPLYGAVAAETVSKKEQVEEEESDLTDDQGLCADGTTDAVPHNADSKPEALEVGGDRDPAKEREEACQASDVCFLGDKDKASMVMPPRKSIQLKESSAEKSADREAEQEVGRPGRHPCNSETKPGLDKRDPRRKQRRVSVLRPTPNDSVQQRHQRRDASSQNQKSSWPEKGKCGVTHLKDPSAGGGCKSKGSSGDADELRLHKGGPSQGLSGRSPGSGQPSKEREQERRPHKVRVLQSGPDSFNRQRHKRPKRRNSRKKNLSSGLGDGNRDNIHPTKASTDSGWKSKKHSSDAKEPKLNKQGGPRQRRARRKFSSRPGESKRQDTYRKEPSIQSRNASNRPRGETRKSTLDAETTRQSRSDEKKKSYEETPSGRKPRVKTSHSSHASTARREDERQNAGTLLDKPSISSKYPGFYDCLRLSFQYSVSWPIFVKRIPKILSSVTTGTPPDVCWLSVPQEVRRGPAPRTKSKATQVSPEVQAVDLQSRTSQQRQHAASPGFWRECTSCSSTTGQAGRPSVSPYSEVSPQGEGARVSPHFTGEGLVQGAASRRSLAAEGQGRLELGDAQACTSTAAPLSEGGRGRRVRLRASTLPRPTQQASSQDVEARDEATEPSALSSDQDDMEWETSQI
ncbi:hypothetical protein HPB47_027868 [Ixodes persulcatus]|uniref:Uncharacterized protein n=1 Tax=Ixodes persulcatus TaxID=34615 RepID=A0AC60PUT6_IXOPE|nr:hypothetical protein HPB47_027868 [Ixodes persulcatus]